MLRSHVQKSFDFHQPRIWEARWWSKLYWTLNSVERMLSVELAREDLRHQTAILGVPGLEEKDFTKGQMAASDLLKSLVSWILPWVDTDPEKAKQSQMTEYRQMYIDVYGMDPTTPEFKALEAKELADYRAYIEKRSNTPSAESQVEQRRRELHAKRQKQQRAPRARRRQQVEHVPV